MGDDERKGLWRNVGRTADVLQILGWVGVPTLLVLVGFLVGSSGDDDREVSEPTAAPTTVSTVESPDRGTTSPRPGTSSASSAPAPPGRTLLSDLPVVDGANDIDIDIADVVIDGTRYQNSVHYSCSSYCDGRSPATYEVSLGGRFARFTATAGIVETGENAPTRIEIDVDGRLAQDVVVSVGDATPIDLPVAGAQRLKITLYAPAPLASPLEAGVEIAGGGQRVLPDVAIGKPELHP